ncbi:transglutaminase domain protein [Parafrankia sp. EAN1pec]|nr:transglutaminase domain protein [Frankia sp. EAN1pec]
MPPPPGAGPPPGSAPAPPAPDGRAGGRPARRRIRAAPAPTPVRTPGPRSFRPGQVALAAVLVALVAVAFTTFFTGGPTGGAGVVLLPAVVLASALGCLAGARLGAGWLVGLVGLIGALLFGVLALFAARFGDGLSALSSEFGSAARDGWARMLTVGLPAHPGADLLFIPVLVLWLAAFAAAVLTVRTDSVLAPVLPAIVGYVVALLLVAARGRSLLVLTGLIALLALVLAVVRASRLAAEGQLSAVAVRPEAAPAAQPDAGRADADGTSGARGGGAGGPARPRVGAGRLALGLPVAAVTALLGTIGAAFLPIADGTDRFDPRDHRHPPVEISTSLNPLVQVKAAHKATAARNLFTVQLSAVGGKVATDRLRTVTLADFDGASWREDGTFVRSGSTLPDGDGLAPTVGNETRMEVTVDTASGPFLPSLGRPVRISGASLEYAFQPDAGVLAVAAPARTGDHYVLTARVPGPTDQQVRGAVPASGPAAARYLELPPGMPAELQDLASRVMSGKSSPYEKLTALEDFLRDQANYPVDLNARPGHSYGALKRFLTGSKADNRGYVEQFATAFALLARAEGFPSRVAVGYLLDSRSSSAPGRFTVTSKQAFAWPEVALDGIGWVAFDPTDISKLGATPPAPSDDQTPGGEGAAPQAQTVPPIVKPELDRAAQTGGGGAGGARNTLLLALLAVVAAAAAVPVGIVGEKARRRQRRRAGTAAARIGGAWREVRDRLAERGVDRSRALTADEVVARTRALRGDAAGERVGSLAPVVSSALFAAAEPGEAEARHAWELAAAVSQELHRSDSLWRRVVAAVDPRPLLPGR